MTEIVALDLFTGAPSVALMLYENVENAKELLSLLKAGTLEVALINPAMVVDKFQILLAANKAVFSLSSGRLRTRNVHTDIIYNLSSSRNISEALSKLGVSESNTSAIVCLLNPTEERLGAITAAIRGHQIPLSMLNEFSIAADIAKFHKVTDDELQTVSIADAVFGRISARESLQ